MTHSHTDMNGMYFTALRSCDTICAFRCAARPVRPSRSLYRAWMVLQASEK
ncbi:MULTISPECIES: permease [Burkholderia]|uniref:permease n=1 Tax=Burkholderia TaxID=32008 RepID=UPI0009EA8A35|nr:MULTISPECIES: permease [Burkholderia]